MSERARTEWPDERRNLQELVAGLYHKRRAVPERLWHTLELALDAFAHEGVEEGGDPHLQVGEDWDEAAAREAKEAGEVAVTAPAWAHPDAQSAYLAARNLFDRVLAGWEPPERDVQRLRHRLDAPAAAAKEAVAAGAASADDLWIAVLLEHTFPVLTKMHEEGAAALHPDDLHAHIRAIESAVLPF